MTSDSAFYLGSELYRAINRMDFFRLFKALALNHDCQYFLLSEIMGEDEGMDLQHTHCLYNLPNDYSPHWNSSGGLLDPVIFQARRFTAPFSMNIMQDRSAPNELGEIEAVVVVPLHTTHAKRYYLMMFGGAGSCIGFPTL